VRFMVRFPGSSRVGLLLKTLGNPEFDDRFTRNTKMSGFPVE